MILVLGGVFTPKTSHQVKEGFFDFWTTALGVGPPRGAQTDGGERFSPECPFRHLK